MGPELGRRPRRLAEHAAGDPNSRAAPEERGRASRSSRPSCILPAAHLQPLPQPVVRRVLPLRRDLQARRGRHRARRPGGVPRLALSASPAARTRRSTSTGRPASPRSASSATRASRPASRRPASTPASAGSATSAWCSTTPTGSRGGLGARRAGAGRGAASALSSTREDPEVARAGRARDGIPERLIEAARRSPVLRLVQGLAGRAAAPPRVPHAADGLVRAAAVAGREPGRGDDRPAARPRATSSPTIDEMRIPIEYLAELPDRRRPRAGARSRCARLAAMRALHARAERRRRRATRRSRAPSGWSPPRWRTMYRLVAIGDYDDRYVIPKAHGEAAGDAFAAPGLVRAGLRGRPGGGGRPPPPTPRGSRATTSTCRDYIARCDPRDEGRPMAERRPAAEARLAAAPVPRAASCVAAARGASSIAAARAPRAAPRLRRRSCDWCDGATRSRELQRRYVETFDFTPGRSLLPHLPRHGDRRQRGDGAAGAEAALRGAPASSSATASCRTTCR